MNNVNINLKELRRSGLSTGLLLEALGRAVQAPGVVVQFKDHLHNERTLEGFKHKLEEMIRLLGLNVIVKKEPGFLEVTSLHQGVYEGNDGCLYKKIAKA